MATICEKDFTLNVGSSVECPTPFAYFKFDSSPAGGASLIETVSGRDLSSLGGTDAISDVGKIGNSWVFGSAVEYRRSDVDYFTGVVSATLRFWYMIPSSFAGEFGIILFLGGLFGSGFAIRHFAFPSRIFQCDFRNDNADLFTIDLPILQDDQFHRVVLRYEHNVAFRCKFDNDSDLSIAANGEISPATVGPSNNQVIVEADFDFQELRLDELLYSKEYLTDSELLADWNDGDGRTFPCQLMGYWTMDEIGAGTRFDSTGNSLDLDDIFGSVSDTVGKISNAVEVGLVIASSDVEMTSASPLLAWPAATSITIAHWFNANVFGASTGEFSLMDYASSLDGAPDSNFAGIRTIMDLGPGPTHLGAKFALGQAPNTFVELVYPITPAEDTWYFMVAWFDADAQTANVQINDGVIVSSACTFLPLLPNDQGIISFSNGSAFTSFKFDEAGIWIGKLSAAQRTSLYNSGNGITWPAVASI